MKRHFNLRSCDQAVRLGALLLALSVAACGGGEGGAIPVSSTDASSEVRPLTGDATPLASDGALETAGQSRFAMAGTPGANKALVTGVGAKPVRGPSDLAVGVAQRDAVRLADQATFGPTEAMVRQIRQMGMERWVMLQLQTYPSRYVSGGSDAIHRHTDLNSGFCDSRGSNCWRDWYSSSPLLWDFYRNATTGPDQLRQRVALALQQLLVISNLEVSGTYGLRNYHNMLLEQAFGNYRDMLRSVILSPVMGDYLNNANNDRDAPNENFARELLQLFSIGTCELNIDGSLRTGTCQPTYDNDDVRAYAYALTGWTYPAGGSSPWGCWPSGTNCRHYGGNMVAVAARHNTQTLSLLSGVSLGSGHTASQALERVLDSLMLHPNTAPFIGRYLIQHLVTSNPSPAYVARVAQAFQEGRFRSIGSGRAGDMKATVAAILLDGEARNPSVPDYAGRLREPIQLFTGVIRLLNGHTDGDALGWSWGEGLQQHVFRSPSVFNFYAPDYPLAGTTLAGPAFGIHNANTALNRLNYINYLVFWGGSSASASVPGALGTQVNLSAFTSSATDAQQLVDRIALLALGEVLPSAQRTLVVNAVEAYPVQTSSPAARETSLINRVRQAAYLVLATPQYHLIR